MKTTPTLRLLSLLAFLLLFAPFYDSCDGIRMKEAKAAVVDEVDSVKIDTTVINEIKIDTINNFAKNDETSFFDIGYSFIDDVNSENALEFAKVNIDAIIEFDYKEFKKDIKSERYEVIFFCLKNLCFSFIVLITSIIFALSFTKKQNVIYNLSIVNIVLLGITIICVFLEGTFDHVRQIKWGYYAFIITSVLIFSNSKILLKQKVNP